jgi:hypothetical protein
MAVEDIGFLVKTKIPGYTDAADIQAALRAYHYGSYTFDTAETNKANLLSPSMAKTISDLQDAINNVDISAAVAKSLVDSKGDLIVGSADNTVARQGVGSNGQVLKADSAQSTGLVWSSALTSLEITLDTTSNATNGRISWDSTNKKIQVGNATAAIDFAPSTLSISTPTFATNAYTAIITDKDKWLELDNSTTAGTFRIPTDASLNFPIGTQLNIIQMGTGQITIAAVTPGTTAVVGTPGLKLRARYSAATIVKRAANSWVAVGDLIA